MTEVNQFGPEVAEDLPGMFQVADYPERQRAVPQESTRRRKLRSPIARKRTAKPSTTG
jgi:hypothetical protein